MKRIILIALFCCVAAPCTAKELHGKPVKKLTPQVMIKAAIEVFTITPPVPAVKIVKVKFINGRRKIVSNEIAHQASNGR